MPVVQEAFDIPVDIMTGIVSGEYRRLGGVVRYAKGPKKGQIVKLLDPVDVKAEEQSKGFAERVMQYAKDNPQYILIAGGVLLFLGAGYIILKSIKKREPEIVSDFKAALKIYLEEIRSGDLHLETITALMDALDEMKKDEDYENIKITLSSKQIDVLVHHIYDYTIRLAKNNQIELTDKECCLTDNSIVNLENYLKAQKRIFETVA